MISAIAAGSPPSRSQDLGVFRPSATRLRCLTDMKALMEIQSQCSVRTGKTVSRWGMSFPGEPRLNCQRGNRSLPRTGMP
jgi:hypothetical protein